jgi:hypothetical protein
MKKLWDDNEVAEQQPGPHQQPGPEQQPDPDKGFLKVFKKPKLAKYMECKFQLTLFCRLSVI